MDILTVLENVAKGMGIAKQVGDLWIELKGVLIKDVTERKEKNEPIKDNVAIIIDYGSMTVEQHVKKYLKAKNIDSTIVKCMNPKGYVHLDMDDRDVWENAVKEMYAFIKEILSAAPKRIHIFISAPATLAFALGYTLRPHCTPYVYQHNQKRDGVADSDLYSMVLHVDSRLRD